MNPRRSQRSALRAQSSLAIIVRAAASSLPANPFEVRHAHRTGPPRPPCGLSPAGLAGQFRRPRCRAAPNPDSRPRAACAQAESGSRRPRACRSRRRRDRAGRRADRWRGGVVGGVHRHRRRPHDHPAAAAAVRARDRDGPRSFRQHQADGALSLGRRLLHAMRGGGLSPHHLFSRPAGRDGRIHHAHRSRPCRSAGAARATAILSRRARSKARRGTSPCGTTRIPSPAICLPWSAAGSTCARTVSPPCPGARSRCASMSSRARRRARPTRWKR